VTKGKIVTLVVNLVILIYLVLKLIADHRKKRSQHRDVGVDHPHRHAVV
jgi:uncharacterized membrane protein (DUF2068 family)